MEKLCDKNHCSGCGACRCVCPYGAIRMEPDEEGFLYPIIDGSLCTGCGLCRKVCGRELKVGTQNKAYACFAADRTEQLTSSSGGAFSVLARQFLKEKGLVCGAAFDEALQVKHVLIDSAEELERLKGTKYVQSDTGSIYKNIHYALAAGRPVLFSGTPCQVGGLKKFLGCDYEGLLCVDVICHGVPSPEVWRKTLLERGGDHRVKKASFRQKEADTGRMYVEYRLDNGEYIREASNDSLYMKGFIQNLYLRPSCFSCSYKGQDRCSDITVGDFWSVREFYPEFSNGLGTSAVITHSPSGERWLKKAMPDLKIIPATAEQIACWNDCLLKCAERTPKRDLFFARCKTEPVLSAIADLAEKKESETGKNGQRIDPVGVLKKLAGWLKNEVR